MKNKFIDLSNVHKIFNSQTLLLDGGTCCLERLSAVSFLVLPVNELHAAFTLPIIMLQRNSHLSEMILWYDDFFF